MKLLLVDEKCDNLLKDTVALLQFIRDYQTQIGDIKIELSNNIKQHTLVLPKTCIKGVDNIFDYFENFIKPSTQQHQQTPPLLYKSNKSDSSIFESQMQLLSLGDEEKDKTTLPITGSQPQQQRQEAPVHRNQSQSAPPQRTQAPVIKTPSADIHNQLLMQLQNGGD